MCFFVRLIFIAVIDYENNFAMKLSRFMLVTQMHQFLCSCSFDELLVSAPLFRANSTEPETGRVYIYRNTGVRMYSYILITLPLVQ